MTTAGWLPAPAEELFGPDATAEESYEVLAVDVPPGSWITALETARDRLGCTYFDWLSAVDEPGTGFHVCAHVVALAPVRRLLLRTTVPHATPALPSAVGVYAGAAWHERETHEMFGVVFSDHPALDHLLLPDGFEGHPLRKDFVLASRVAKAWPGAKEPGESEHGGPKRRQMLPPGVPDPNEWGPLKGQLPPAPTRPARGAPGERPSRTTPGERPVRRARTASEGSASQGASAATGPTAAGERPARRARTSAEGSASQASVSASGTADEATPASPQPTPERTSGSPTGPRRSRSASEGSASQRGEGTAPAGEPQPAPEHRDTNSTTDTTSATAPTDPSAEPSATPPRPAGPRRARSASEGSASQRPSTAPRQRPSTAPRSSDAPWHHARPAFGEPEPTKPEDRPETPTPETPTSESPTPETKTPEIKTSETSAPDEPTPDEPTPDQPTPENPHGGPQ
ncbi:NADH-quinone oxidoreductase subunit C [Streptomyces sp. A012304]|uniref:NADH-quinone oxidoreductase subunit C n=1 Tax=Streptomyces sp. A012304 TaxID=375446 RepID=UPI00222FE028|nr:NADH-quinone oxidoreductase subunit C [Streptomyces sp. A012304]GKQ35689.1 dehydrogenase [Streptomyces sp. A012304]